MESIETPMKSNVSMPVGTRTMSPVAPEMGTQIERPAVEFSSPQIEEKSQDQEVSDRILSSAKEDGFEEALIQLAEGGFDEVSNPELENDERDEDILEDEEVSDFEHEGLDQAKDAEPQEVSEKPEEQIDNVSEDQDNGEKKLTEKDVLISRIKELETQAKGLEEKNQELFDKVKDLETTNQVVMQTLLEMTAALHELIKREEEDEDKTPMIILMIELMTNFVRAILEVGDDQKGSNGTARSTTEKATPKKKSSKPRIQQIIQELRKRGTVSNTEPRPQPQHAQAA